jgi:glutathione synthase/RimK-type ligase-like ATP-grasp enzyme
MKAVLSKLRSVITRHYPSIFPEASFRRAIRRHRRTNPYIGSPEESSFESGSRFRMGIVKDFAEWHRHYAAACLEMGISYRVLDVYAENWQELIRTSGCDALLVWPPAAMTVHKQMLDERLKVAVEVMNQVLFPSYDELWMWGSKRRMCYWLTAHGISTPRTWVFYSPDHAMRFAETSPLPIVVKTDHGDSAKGVWIVRTRREARNHVRRAFFRGYRFPGSHHRDVQWGNIIFQQYIETGIEWRLIRVGNSFFGYHKKKIGDFASGFGQAIYGEVPQSMLHLIRKVTDQHKFYSMSMDVLTGSDGCLYVTEMQSLFGDPVSQRKLIIDGKAGRYVYCSEQAEWKFEEGVFDQNHCCNLRVAHIIQQLEKSYAGN